MGANQGVIELAPTNVNGLPITTPVIVAPGCSGALRWSASEQIGAVATDVAVLASPRTGPARLGLTPAGIVFERLPSIKFDALLRSERRRWSRSPVPILLTLRGTADDLIEMATRLETVEGVAGLVLLVRDLFVDQAVALVRGVTTLPLLQVLPFTPQIDEVAVAVVAAGADALVLCGYPPAAAPSGDEIVSGLLVGPALAPWTLRALELVKHAVDVPLIAWGGVADAAITRQCLRAGASAVMIDGALYGDPFAVQRVASTIGS